MTRPRMLAAATAALMILAACGEQVGTSQNEDDTPTFPSPPDQLPDDVEQPDVVIPVPPVAEEARPVPLSLDDPRLDTEFPVTLVARPDGTPFAGDFQGRASVEQRGRVLLVESEEVAVALQLPASLHVPEVGGEVDLAVSYLDDPSETGGANHTVEVVQDDTLIAATAWRTSPEPIRLQLAAVAIAQRAVEPDPETEYTPVPALVDGNIELALLEPQRVDDKAIVVNQSERFVADDPETFGDSYILRLWMTSQRR